MRRRAFIALAGGAAVAWPLAARARQTPVVGRLLAETPGPCAANLAAIRRGLGEAGHVEGDNLAIEYRRAETHYDRLPALAADWVRRRIDVIVAIGAVAASAAMAATSIIPIVFVTAGDPVEEVLLASFNSSGGNLTGVSFLVNSLARTLGLTFPLSLHGRADGVTE